MNVKFRNLKEVPFKDISINQAFMFNTKSAVHVKMAEGDYNNTLSLEDYKYYTTKLTTIVIPVKIVETVVEVV